MLIPTTSLSKIHPQSSPKMNPAQQAFPGSVETHLVALEQALANSKAREEETRKQLDLLTHGFKQLEGLILEQRNSQKNVLPNIPAILLGWPLPPTLPTEFDGERSQGQAFLNSVQTYMCLCPDSFHSDQIKITWTLSYMKSGRAAKWAAWVFKWEEDNGGYSKFLDWDEFWTEFQKDFCPTHSNTATINKLESVSYYQKAQSVDNYLDEFLELILEVGYTNLLVACTFFNNPLASVDRPLLLGDDRTTSRVLSLTNE